MILDYQKLNIMKIKSSLKTAKVRDKNNQLVKRKGKLFRFAAQRGFESDLIHRILNMDEGEFEVD